MLDKTSILLSFISLISCSSYKSFTFKIPHFFARMFQHLANNNDHEIPNDS